MVYLHELVFQAATGPATRPHLNGTLVRPVLLKVRVRLPGGEAVEVPVESFKVVPGPIQPDGDEKNRLLGPSTVVLVCAVPAPEPAVEPEAVAEDAYDVMLEPAFEGTYPTDYAHVQAYKDPPTTGTKERAAWDEEQDRRQREREAVDGKAD